MDDASLSPEQQQLVVEINAVMANLDKQESGVDASYEREQGRKLIEKAAKINLPEAAYSKLQQLVTTDASR